MSRRDRGGSKLSDHKGWGGIALFARADVHQHIVVESTSTSLELSWHTLHSDIGPVLLGLWYRPPRRGDVSSIEQFDRELHCFSEHVAKFIIGDMNVHNE